MSLSTDTLWSAEQQEWLSALGHTLYVSGPLPVAALEDSAPLAQPQTSCAPAPSASATTRGAPPAPAARPAANTPTPMPPRRAAGGLPDRLHFALIRASGCNPNAEGAAEIIAQWPSSAELRGNPAAKRALWPTLRKLRRPKP